MTSKSAELAGEAYEFYYKTRVVPESYAAELERALVDALVFAEYDLQPDRAMRDRWLKVLGMTIEQVDTAWKALCT